MGKPALPPQGAGTPVLFLAGLKGLAALGDRVRDPVPHMLLAVLGWTAQAAVPTWFTLLPKKYVCRYEEGEEYGDYAVHGEEGGVQFGEIVGLDQGMFVEQEQHYCDNAG